MKTVTKSKRADLSKLNDEQKKERQRQQRREWYQKNKVWANVYHKEWRDMNPEKVEMFNSRRRKSEQNG